MDRKYSEAVRAKCKLICNTCYVDDDVVNDILLDHGLEPDDTAQPDKVAAIVECAILIVKGWVETSRSEGGISTSINIESVKNNILFWCGRCGLDASEYLSDELSSIEDGSKLW
jgi:hypothetical protein